MFGLLGEFPDEGLSPAMSCICPCRDKRSEFRLKIGVCLRAGGRSQEAGMRCGEILAKTVVVLGGGDNERWRDVVEMCRVGGAWRHE